MLLRVIMTALLATVAGSAFAADAVRPVFAPPAPVAAGPTAAGDLSIAGGGLWLSEGGTTETATGQGRASLPSAWQSGISRPSSMPPTYS